MKHRIALKRIDLEADGCHLILTACWHKVKMRLVLDTGASKTVFDKATIMALFPEIEMLESEQQSAGLGTSAMESHLFDLTGLRLGSCQIAGLQAAALDLSHILKSYSEMGELPIQGILGGDILYKYGAKIDYRKLTLLLRDDA